MAKINIANGIISSSADYGLYRGTSKIVNIQDGEFRVLGDLIAENYIVSSSVSNIEYQSLSGSTIFGDSADDTHVLSGSVTIKSPSGDALILDDNNNGANKLSWAYNGTSQYYMRRLHTDGEFYISSNGSGGAVNITGDSNHGNMPVHIGYRLGIGNTGPAAKLHVSSNSDTSEAFVIIEDTDTTAGSQIPQIEWRGNTATFGFFRYTKDGAFFRSAAESNLMHVSGSGQVGIGTTSPEQKLHIKETDSSFGNTTLHIENAKSDDAAVLILEGARTSTNDTAQISFMNSGDVGAAIKAFSGHGGNNDSGEIQFSVSEDGTASSLTTAMTIDTNTKIGIGTTSPAYKLQVTQAESAASDFQTNLDLVRTWGAGSSTDRYHGLIFSDSNSVNAGIFANRLASHANYNSDLHFYTNAGSSNMTPATALSTSKMMITAAGNVGINTTSPGQKLTVQGGSMEITGSGGIGIFFTGTADGSNKNALYFRTQGGTEKYRMIHDQSADGTDDIVFKAAANTITTLALKQDGKVGIGTTSPGQGQSTPISDVKLDVLGNQMLSDLSTTNTDQSKLFFFRSDGAVASQGVVPDGLKIGAIEWAALTSGDNNNSISSALIEVEASNTWSSAAVRNADIIFSTVGANALTEKLRITSDAKISGSATSTGSFGELIIDSNGTFGGTISSNVISITTDGGAVGGDFNGTTVGRGQLHLNRDDTATVKQIQFYKNGSEHSYLETSTSGLNIGGANVGIGTASPDFKLEVVGTTYISGNTSIGRDQALNPRLSISSAIKSSDLGLANTGMALCIDSGVGDSTNSVGHLAQIGLGLLNAYQPAAIGAMVSSGTAYTSTHLVFATRSSTSDIAPTERVRIQDDGNVGIGTTSPGSLLTIKDTGDISTATFISGITGDGFRIKDDGADGVSLEIDNIMVRNTLRTHIFQKDTVKATNGILMVSDSGVISGSNGTDTVTFLNSKSATFADNTRLWYKDVREDDGTVISVQFDINGSGTDAGGSTTYSVDNIAGSLGDLTGSLGTSGGTAVRISGGSILLDASTPDSPFIDVLQSSGSGTGNGTVMRMGNLDGITSPTLGSLSGFGIWASGSAYFEGKINATAGGVIAGWDLNEATIEKVDSNGGVKIDSTNKRIDFLSDASTTRLRVGQVDSNKFGIRGFDSNADRVFEISETRNEIAGWDITPGNIVSDNSEGSVALSSTDQALTIWTGSINGAEPKLVVGKLPINDGTVQNPYGFAVFSGAGPVTSSVNADSASVLITANKARLAGWELVPGRLKSGTVADINGNKASIALGTGATTATATPTDGLFFVSASAQPVFYVGSTFSYVNDTLTAGGWTIGGGVISSSKETSNVPNAILSGSGVLSLGTGAHGFDTANRTFIDGPGNRMSIGTGFKYESDSLTIDGNASIGGFNIGTTQFTSAPSGQGQIALNESFIQFKANNSSTDRLNDYKITVTDETNTSDAKFFPQGATGGTNDSTRFVRIRMGLGEAEGDPGYKSTPADGGNVEYAYNNAFGEPLLDTAAHRYPMSESFSITMLSGSANDKDYGTTLRYLVNHDVGSRRGINSGNNGEVMRIGKIATTEGDFLYNNPGGFTDDSISRIFHYGISGSIATTASFGTYYGDGSNLTGLAGGGNVSNSGTPSAGQVAVWTDSETIQGTSNFIIDSNSRISLSNNAGGASNTVFGKLAGNDLNANSGFNVLIGEDAGGSLTGGTNSGEENCIIGSNAVDTSTDAFRVTAIGTSVMRGALTTAAEGTVGIGYLALNVLTSGEGNTAVGFQALKTEDDGDHNTAIGYNALRDQTGTTGIIGNTAVGYEAGVKITTGKNNTVLGSQALSNETDGKFNVAIGWKAGRNMTGALDNVIIGYKAMANIDNNPGDEIANCVAIGYEAFLGSDNNTTGTTTDANGTIAIGHSSLKVLTSGIGNTAVGFEALKAEDDGDFNTAIGHQALTAQTGISGTVGNTAVGYHAATNITTGYGNTVMGYLAFSTANGAENQSVVIGREAGKDIDSNSTTENVIIGSNAGKGGTGNMINAVIIGSNAANSTAANSHTGIVAIGYDALTSLTSGTKNTAVGYEALKSCDDGLNNTALGYQALTANAGNNNTGLGYLALRATTGAQNTAVGMQASHNIGGGANNVSLGMNSLLDVVDGSQNVAIGSQAIGGTLGTTADNASDLIAIGYQAMGGNWENVALTDNIAIGTSAMGGAINGAINCIAIGRETLDGVLTTGANGTVGIGYQALKVLTSGGKNLAIGYQAGLESTIEDFNTYIGYQSGYRTAGLNNQHNTFVGYNAGSGDWTSTLSSKNTAIGSNAMVGAMNSSLQNSAMGYAALSSLTTGNNNIGIGVTAGDVITTGGSNTIIGSESDPSANSATNQTVIGYGVTGQADNSVTLGNADTTAVYMAQDSGATVHASVIVIGDGTADAPSVQLGSANDGFFHHTDGVKIMVNNANEVLFANGGDFHSDGDVIAFSTTISDKRLKDNVVTIESPIDKIKKLRGVEYVWNMGKRKGQKDLGVIAQEVEKVIPEIVKEKLMPFIDDTDTKYKTVDYEKLTAVLIEGMKDQQEQIDDLRKQIKEMKDGSS